MLDGATGRLVAVTRAGAGAGDPAFSPDGRWLAYTVGHGWGVARSDGAHPHTRPAPGAQWLPDGRLLAGHTLYRLRADGRPVPDGAAPPGLAAWAPDGSRFAFVVSRGGRNGVELLQVADSLTGPRTTWYRVPQRFTPSGGYRSSAIADVVVLPGRRGLLVWLDPLHSASLAADGRPVYELTRPDASPRRLGTTVGATASTAGGRVALGAGVDRYAWRTKQVVTCSGVRCTPLPTPKGTLTLEPALSPEGARLAYVSAKQEPAGDVSQPSLRRWYATRRLRVGGREIHGSAGAAFPTWSRDGTSLLFVKDDAIWLLPRLDGRPVRVAGPLYPPGDWPSYYGEIGWSSLFAWSS